MSVKDDAPAGGDALVPGVLFVDRFDVLRFWDIGDAMRLLRAALDEPGGRAAVWALAAERCGSGADDLDRQLELVARDLVEGRLVAVQLPRRMIGGVPHIRPDSAGASDFAPLLSDLLPGRAERRPSNVEPVTTFAMFVLLTVGGEPLPDVDFELTLPDGTTIRERTGAQGQFRVDDLPHAGGCTGGFDETIEVPAASAAPSRSAPPGGVSIACDERAAIAFATDRLQPIVVLPAVAQPTVSFSSALFATDSSFPTAAISSLLRHAQDLTDRVPSARIGVFGHTDTRDGVQANKVLADRRAEIVYALLVGNLDGFAAVAAAEDWPLSCYQSMLRVLGCNPTAIDDGPGPQTDLAVRAFRSAYNHDTWHEHGLARAFGDLPDGDALDGPTKKAIVDAYHAHVCVAVAPDRFHGPKHAGCGEWNPIGEQHADNRRVTLAVYGSDAPEPHEFPCKAGDAAACRIDDGGQFRCTFYRERIREQSVLAHPFPFWDFEWLPTESGKAHLSALTHLPDTNDAEIVVRVVEGGKQPFEDSGEGDEAPTHGEEVVVLPALIRSGVAYALWDHGTQYDPFDMRDWFRKPSEPEDARIWLASYLPPVFSVRSQGWWGFSGGPGPRLRTTTFSERPSAEVLAFTANGSAVLLTTADELPRVDEGHRGTAAFAVDIAVRSTGAEHG